MRLASWRSLNIEYGDIGTRVRLFPILVPSSSFLVYFPLSFSLVQYDPRDTRRALFQAFPSVHVILAIARLIPMNFQRIVHMRIHVHTYAHMYANICVYIPVPVPVQ